MAKPTDSGWVVITCPACRWSTGSAMGSAILTAVGRASHHIRTKHPGCAQVVATLHLADVCGDHEWSPKG